MTKKGILLATGVLTVLICALFGKPIWVDEVSSLALAAFSPWEAPKVFIDSLPNLNIAQTGFYFFITYIPLKLFGASIFWVRFPALISGFWLFFCAYHFFKRFELPFRWQLWGFLALFSSPTIVYHIAEGRVYMPLAAAIAGTLVFYSTPLHERNSVNAIGWVSVVWGTLMHPYFIVYWGLIGLLTLQEPFLKHWNKRLSLVGLGLYFGLGLTTWMTHPPGAMHFEPFQWLNKSLPIWFQITLAHFQFSQVIFSYFLVAILCSLFLLSPRRPALMLALGLILGGLAMTAAISYLSYIKGYWIIHRQWIGSVTLTVLGSTLLVFQIEKLLNRPAKVAWFGVLFLVVSFHSFTLARARIQYSMTFLTAPPSLVQLNSFGPIKDNTDWEHFAQANIDHGGKVHSRLRGFYGK